MAQARRSALLTGAMLVFTLACVALAGWTIYDAVRGPGPAHVDFKRQVEPGRPWGRRHNVPQDKLATPATARPDAPGGF